MDNQNEEKRDEGTDQQDEKQYPPLRQVLPAMIAIYLAVFLVALDRTIIGTAVPTISNKFNSFGDIAWYEAGFLLPLCVFQLSFGRIYKFYSAKYVEIVLVFIFEVGSIVCATAPNSNALIVGRVVQGLGAAGISSGAFVLISLLVPLKDRPKYGGGLGATFGLSSILGPILGGYLTSVSWRWCFWINAPLGGLALALLVFLTPKTDPPTKRADTWVGKIKDLDPLGFSLIAPAIVCLLFAIEWGGIEYPWSDGRIIALFVVFGVLGLGFIASQIWQQENATLPPRIFRQRTILAGGVANVAIGSTLVIWAFYLPIWFQIIQGKSPEDSGLSLLPLFLSTVVAVIGCGILTSVIGYYTPIMIGGSAVMVVGAGLLTTFSPNIPPRIWIGYQILLGLGQGAVLQAPVIAAQTVLSDSDVPIGLALLSFVSFLGGTTFVPVSQSLLENKLISGLRAVAPEIDTSMLANGGASSVVKTIPAEKLAEVRSVYNGSIQSIWYLGLGLASLVFLAALCMEWKSVKAKKPEEPASEA